MENTTNLLSKKVTDLTVGDAVKLNLAAPILVIASMVGCAAVVVASEKTIDMFKKVRANRRMKNITVVK